MHTALLAGASLATLVCAIVGYGLGAYLLSKKKIFFTAPREGTGEFVMVGNTVHKLIANWKGHRAQGFSSTLSTDPYTIESKEPEYGLLHYANPLTWMEPFGIYWMGVWPWFTIYRYDFVWTEEEQGPDGSVTLRTRRATKQPGTEGQTSFVYLKDVNYFVTTDDVKTKGGIPLRFQILVTVRITNPYKALFKGTNWLQRMSSAVNDVVVLYAGALEYEDVVASTPATLSRHLHGTQLPPTEYSLEELIQLVGNMDRNDITDCALESDYGIKIVAAKRHNIDFASEDGRRAYQEATTARYKATQEGLAAVERAKGDATAIGIRATAESNRIETTYGAVSPDREMFLEIRRLEALAQAGAAGGTTIVLPSNVLGLANFLNKLAQPKPDSSTPPQAERE